MRKGRPKVCADLDRRRTATIGFAGAPIAHGAPRCPARANHSGVRRRNRQQGRRATTARYARDRCQVPRDMLHFDAEHRCTVTEDAGAAEAPADHNRESL